MNRDEIKERFKIFGPMEISESKTMLDFKMPDDLIFCFTKYGDRFYFTFAANDSGILYKEGLVCGDLSAEFKRNIIFNLDLFEIYEIE